MKSITLSAADTTYGRSGVREKNRPMNTTRAHAVECTCA